MIQEMDHHLSRIRAALDAFAATNHREAVDEPANDFEKAVNKHYLLTALQNEIKELVKPLNEDERELRDGIAASLRVHFGDELKEGVNNYELSNRRKLKFTHKVDRAVDTDMVAIARKEYEAAEDKPAALTFDGLLRVKYELNKAPWKKLVGSALKAASRMITSKLAAPTLEVD